MRRLAALAAVVLLVAACSAGGGAADETADGAGGELQSTHWVLASYASGGALVIVPEDQYADAEFTAQRVKGFAGCNDYDAVYRTGARLLLVSMPATTRVTCGEVADAFESSYLGLLQQSRFYNVRAGTLTIRGADRTVLLVFEAAPANPLLGPWLVESYTTGPGSVVAPLEGTELTVAFRLLRVGGSAGCNSFSGYYTTNGAIVAIGPLATTQKACPEAVMAQETSFLAALKGVGRIESRGRTLQLQDRSGGILVALARPSTAEPEPSATLAPSASPKGSIAPAATATPTAVPSATPSASPTQAPTAPPTAAPTPVPSHTPAPTVAPPASEPPVATCALVVPTTLTATIVYPSAWHTLAAPPLLACRYFDPNPIVVPADPATLKAAVMVRVDLTLSYQDALAAATDPIAWNVLINAPVTISGLPATRIEATSTAGSPGFPVGVTRYGYLIDLAGHAGWFETSGTVGSPTFVTNSSVVDLMAAESTITIPN